MSLASWVRACKEPDWTKPGWLGWCKPGWPGWCKPGWPGWSKHRNAPVFLQSIGAIGLLYKAMRACGAQGSCIARPLPGRGRYALRHRAPA